MEKETKETLETQAGNINWTILRKLNMVTHPSANLGSLGLTSGYMYNPWVAPSRIISGQRELINAPLPWIH